MKCVQRLREKYNHLEFCVSASVSFQKYNKTRHLNATENVAILLPFAILSESSCSFPHLLYSLRSSVVSWIFFSFYFKESRFQGKKTANEHNLEENKVKPLETQTYQVTRVFDISLIFS